ncbi:MAG: hypothetical protein ABSA13_14755 [Beijerinckiaceae bacterium]|jgi:capsular polysaccharide transport system permease protein
MVQSSGTSRAADETFAVNDYLTSRDVVDLLVANNKLRDILRRPEADIFNRFPNFWSRDNKEQLYRRYKSMVTATIDDTTGISTIEVNAFRAADAQALTAALLGYAEGIVNKLNERAYQDALKTSNHFVDLALADVKAAESELSAFRNNSGMVDPNHESDSTLRIIESLSIELARVQATMSQQAALTPNSPKAAASREQVRSLEDEILRRKLQIAGTNASAANQLGKFEELVLKRELAAKSLENAVLSRDKARQNVEQQHMYVQTITQPNLPDTARYPRTMLDLLGVGAISLLIFLVLRGFRDVALEHKA